MENSNTRKTYSIAIRTIGQAGENYRELLNSIEKLCIKPEKIVVVLPNGYAIPEERLGYEEFVFSEKSMILQRIEALKYISSDYTLFLDDDISFSPDFVEKLIKALDFQCVDCVTGPLFSFFPRSVLGKIAGTFMGKAAFRFFNRGYYVRILPNGGWSYRYINTKRTKCYPTESFAWTCFMIKTEVMRVLELEKEKCWIERNGYAWGDDRVMAYKLVKNGYRACIVSSAIYTHNDAKTSTANFDKSKKIFCSAFFSKVFWKRFIQETEKNYLKRWRNRFCFECSVFFEKIYFKIKTVFGAGHYSEYESFVKGLQEAENFLSGESYKKLPSIYVRRI